VIMLRAVFCCWWLVIDEAFLFFFFLNRSRFSSGWVFGEVLAGADEVNT